jgi:DNA polymerase III alpha subunit
MKSLPLQVRLLPIFKNLEDEVFASVWDGDESRGYTFKKSHAISYAALVALHMNLLNTAN